MFVLKFKMIKKKITIVPDKVFSQSYIFKYIDKFFKQLKEILPLKILLNDQLIESIFHLIVVIVIVHFQLY